jgi:hypothetical protein
MYCDINFPTKKALKEAVASGQAVTIFSPGPFPVDCSTGKHCVEGPHYPQPQRWYASVVVQDGRIVSVK